MEYSPHNSYAAVQSLTLSKVRSESMVWNRFQREKYPTRLTSRTLLGQSSHYTPAQI